MHADPVFATVNHFGTFKTEMECTLCAHGIYNPIAAKSFQLRADQLGCETNHKLIHK
jgi:hypothetical protein